MAEPDMTPDLTPDLTMSQALEALEAYQGHLSYAAAKRSLAEILVNLDLSDRERVGLETAIADLEDMLDKLENEVIHIAVFGMVGRGKSSLLNALLGEPWFETGPIHGVTRTEASAEWQLMDEELGRADGAEGSWASASILRRSSIELIDTPGIDEVAGEDRQALAEQVARKADLILFVIAGDMTQVEHRALTVLRQASKPILLVFNKVDQYPDTDRQAIYAKIRDERVRELLSPDEIVMAAASPLIPKVYHDPDGTVRAKLVPGPPQVTALKLKILEILEREGKALVALNSLLYANDIHEKITQRKMDIRETEANQIIWKGAVTKALAIALNPFAVVDILSSLAIDVATIQILSRLYGIDMTQEGATELLQNIALGMGSISATELVTNMGLSSLKGLLGLTAPVTGGLSLVPYISVAMTQGAIAGVSSYGIGQVTKAYLANGAAWGPAGPKTVVRNILNTMDQTYVLSRLKQELHGRLYSGA
ncbi:DUF697 domain-containing protein [Candidatus Synechococcus calcipolaris G9]|uniref:DUF697 domain-containing protein n=1 Tax=Candidatus Synechococcus calcipolaris G9 TaxID=1497997 RepID=A0ABT6EUZ1_9SYNE|nr:DUF697 domain-containing protein [Candidatus Synechococcus calcipolaris]MDG2989656.1 DUF697 domain-containing protein [Candidatus Synechococcus calcipolaris G9]